MCVDIVLTGRALIAFTENAGSQQVWKGYLYAALFFAESIIYSGFYHQMFYIGMTTGMKIKAAVIAMVYGKVRQSTSIYVFFTQKYGNKYNK